MSTDACGKRTIKPSARLIADNNTAQPALPSHRKSIALVQAQRAFATAEISETSSVSTTGPSGPSQESQDTDHSVSLVTGPLVEPTASIIASQRSSPALITADSSSESSDSEAAAANTKKRKRARNKSGSSRKVPETDKNGMYKDVDVLEIDSDAPSDSEKKKKNPTADIEHFFEALARLKGDTGRRCRCKPCANGDGGQNNVDRILVDQHSTLRRHMASQHENIYKRWCKSTGFVSMLPKDAKARRDEANEKTMEQTQVDDHFKVLKPEDKPAPYSDKLFQEVSIRWLVETDQPISSFEHPAFQQMILIASRATHGVNILNRKQTRDEIIALFKMQMHKLKERLNSRYVSGQVSLTCDAWQASNTDGYFAVTGHWIEERSTGNWTLEHALLGFTRMNTAHNGIRLGQALFKICDRLEAIPKIGHITCDNAANNGTMMLEFARCYKGKTGKDFDVKKCHIRCLAHIINIATQALIRTRSKTKYYNPHDIDEHTPDVTAPERDELGLIRAISVKERSSSQRKELFKSIQSRQGVERPVQLLLDMKVRWGSTYVMLNRSDSNKKFVNEFVYELGIRTDNLEARKKIDALRLSEAEWERVGLFCSVLSHADKAQQAFSSVQKPTLFNAIPSIETLHAAWTSRADKYKYLPFQDALNAATAKLNKYYKKTAESDAHILAMLLHPERKAGHFKKHWDKKLQGEVSALGREAFRKHYEQLQDNSVSSESQASQASTTRPVKRQKTKGLLRDADSDSGGDSDSVTESPGDPWMAEYDQYIRTNDIIPSGMTVITWWGLNAPRYPIASSLARDYLAVMALSVSSERAFLSAGLTISKHRNRLKGDIVEALQCLKCMFHNDLIFQKVVSATQEEEDLEDMDLELAGGDGPDGPDGKRVVEGFTTWDALLSDDEDMYENVS